MMAELREMLPMILEKTDENKLEWVEYSDVQFAASIGTLTILIEAYKSRSSASVSITRTRHRLQLRNLSGSVIDSFSGSNDQEYDALKDLFGKARRSAYKVDESLDELKDMLTRL